MINRIICFVLLLSSGLLFEGVNSADCSYSVKPGDTIRIKVQNSHNSSGPMEDIVISREILLIEGEHFLSLEETIPDNLAAGESGKLTYRVIDNGTTSSKIKLNFSLSSGADSSFLPTAWNVTGISINYSDDNSGNNGGSIPTLSEWKQLFLTLFMIALVMGYNPRLSKDLRLNLSGTLSRRVNLSVGHLTFNKQLFYYTMKMVLSISFLGIIGAAILFGQVKILDIAGTFICAPLTAYILHLLIFFIKTRQNA